MKRTLPLSVLVAFVAGVLLQASRQSPGTPRSVAGTWAVVMVNRPEAIRLDLTADGATVRGTFDGSAVVGEVKDGLLTFADTTSWAAWREGTIGNDDAAVMYPTVVSARLGENGTLTGWTDVFIRGYGPQPIKRLNWTAVRTTSK